MNLSIEHKISLAGVTVMVLLYAGIMTGAGILFFLAETPADKILIGALAGALVLITLPIIILVQVRMLKIKCNATRSLLEKIQHHLGGEITLPTLLYFAVNPSLSGNYQDANFKIAVMPSRSSSLNYLARKAVETPAAKFGSPKLNNFELIVGRKRLSFRISIHIDKPQKQKVVFVPKIKIFHAGKLHVHHNPLLSQIEITHHCVCDNSPASLEFLHDPAKIAACEVILSKNQPFITKLDFSDSGIWWISPLSKQIGSTELVELVKQLQNLSRE